MVQRVLLTGANGFVGSHVLDQLLARGFSVRSIVRSQAKAQQVLSDFPNFGTRLDFGIIPDITAPGAFDEVVKSNPPFDTVIHTASPFLCKFLQIYPRDSTAHRFADKVISDLSEFLNPAIKGTLEVLKSVKAHAPGVTRVVITSSCAAVVNFGGNPNAAPQKVYTEADWNPTTWEGALTGTPNNAYQASKKFAEKSGTLIPLSVLFN